MEIYLPIAQMPINIFLILGLGLAVGIIGGIFGIGGGFLTTPLLIFAQVPPVVAVATSSNQIVASSFSSLLVHIKKGSVDFKMGTVLFLGGMVGSSFGIWIFNIIRKLGYIDVVISLIYVMFLGMISLLMIVDSVKYFLRNKYNFFQKKEVDSPSNFIKKLHNLPFQVYFAKSDLKISIIPPILIGLLTGIIIPMIGIGGGFIIIPAMIYLLKMPTSTVVGTSFFQIIFSASNSTILHSITNHSVDVVLAFLMIVTSVIGAQIGTKISFKINPNNFKILLALMIFAVCVRMVFLLTLEPNDPFSIEVYK